MLSEIKNVYTGVRGLARVEMREEGEEKVKEKRRGRTNPWSACLLEGLSLYYISQRYSTFRDGKVTFLCSGNGTNQLSISVITHWWPSQVELMGPPWFPFSLT